MKLRNQDDILISDMSYYDIRQYILKMEDEIRKLRMLSKAHKKSIRDMQRILERTNLREEVLNEWQERKKMIGNQVTYVGLLPPAPTLYPINRDSLKITCDTE